VGTYTVVGTYAGTSNYLPATNTATLKIVYQTYLPFVTMSN